MCFSHEFQRRFLPPLLLLAAGVIAYANSFQGQFVFDDANDILGNPRIHHPWASWQAVPGPWRPVSFFTLSVNYALGKDDVRGYHAVNLAIHLLAGLTLYGIVRRTLLLDAYRNRFEKSAHWLALAAALLWLVHPIQVESVTYIVHRYEALMGMFYLLTLYCVIRCATVPSPSCGGGGKSPPTAWWQVAAVACCALGMGSKEVMVTAPLVVLIYDRVFLAESWGKLVRRRGLLYLGLAATWGILIIPIRSVLTGQVAWAGFDPERNTKLDPLLYLLSQPRVILHYLQHALWPNHLCIDHAWSYFKEWVDVAPPSLLIMSLLGGTLYALKKRPWLGFLGVWFFVVLAPTSSFMPIQDLATDRRMYLPLAAVAVLAVLAGHALIEILGRRLGPKQYAFLSGGAIALPVLALAWLTIERNRLFHDPEVFWLDVIAKSPQNSRAYSNLGKVLLDKEKTDEAVAQFQKARDVNPYTLDALRNLGVAYEKQGREKEAIECYQNVLALSSGRHAGTHFDLGVIFLKKENWANALMHFTNALRSNPEYVPAHYNIGYVYWKQGKIEEAKEHYQEAIRLKPDYAEPYCRLGGILWEQNQKEAALECIHKALELNPNLAEAYNQLGAISAIQGNLNQAFEQFQRAVELDSKLSLAHNHLGTVLLELGRIDDAVASYREAVKLLPKHRRFRLDLADALHKNGQDEASREQYREHDRIDPGWRKEVLDSVWKLAINPDPAKRDDRELSKLVEHVRRATEKKDARTLDILGAAYAELGRFDEAVTAAQQALALATSAKDTTLAGQIEERIRSYQKQQPFREKGAAGGAKR